MRFRKRQGGKGGWGVEVAVNKFTGSPKSPFPPPYCPNTNMSMCMVWWKTEKIRGRYLVCQQTWSWQEDLWVLHYFFHRSHITTYSSKSHFSRPRRSLPSLEYTILPKFIKSTRQRRRRWWRKWKGMDTTNTNHSPNHVYGVGLMDGSII